VIQAIAPTMNAEPALQFGVMRHQVTALKGPTNLFAINVDTCQILIGKTQSDATPGQTATANLQTSRPEKRLVRRVVVRVDSFVGVQPRVCFPVARMLGLSVMAAAGQSNDPP
jgi:hypothetical protein